MNTGMRNGIVAAMAAAILFGISTPLAKLLLAYTSPWLLAALLYLGSGIGLWVVRLIRHMPAVHPGSGDWRWLAGAIVTGGIFAPILLMLGLSAMPASGASLLLNAESVFTALLAWFAFKENFDYRIALGMLAIVAGAVVLSWPQTVHFTAVWPSLAILGACLAWGVDNNLTRKVSLSDASFIAMTKGLIAGFTNLVLALFIQHTAWPGTWVISGSLILGFASYGLSLTWFVIALRQLGTARTGAYFAVAPFFGAIVSIVLLDEPVTIPLLAAGVLMALGTWLHLTEHHEHRHTHDELKHNHEHVHDEHHQHEHAYPVTPGSKHRHLHQHETLRHTHPHFPDMHHQHRH
uniref:Putative permease n=1 Tax=mine drainage metagenome TaxID=410659 RepID=E6QQS0_9ZZZZ